MAYVITDDCTVCGSCIEVCPVDAIHPNRDEWGDACLTENCGDGTDKQIYINPDECIDCGACVSECPHDAIFEADDLPEGKEGTADANGAFFE